MQFIKDNYNFYEENSCFEVSLKSVIGTREEQQDSAAVRLNYDNGIIVICDGMGGHKGGKLASSIAAEKMAENFNNKPQNANIPSTFLNILDALDSEVMNLKNSDGTTMKAGTTLVAAFVEKRLIHWASVGDSRIYIIRGEEIVQVTKDHNYKFRLDNQLEENKISLQQYKEKIIDGEALISFLGVGGLELIDINAEPFTLYPDDKILLTTDGLYKALNDETILKIISNFSNIKEATEALIKKAQRTTKGSSLDNTTISLIRIK